MRRFLSVLAVLAGSAAAALGNSYGAPIFPGSYHLDMVGPPAVSMPLVASEGPPKTVTLAGVVYTWDIETGTYNAPSPNGDNLCFWPGGAVFLEDWPPFPIAGPPVMVYGQLKPDKGD